ncbi:hypothetical protein GJ654_16695 [Rhodoblastus acidophilus]|uniref:DnaJ domain-containing protein n=1 Tax=Rhodoblastus acidophilus TaxID=1074 RepID=A0A6N8DS25_RHOAC|nr:hypothetical protein [Rhodoblastus acidophilus]MCW2275953.1 hypothetical protein [Rhodoblastus acidophilus]MTV32626.1 hypothetical protein [Rhodoblastus acidophilus]
MLPFGRSPPVEPIPPPPPKPELTGDEREKVSALGFFCGALTRDDTLYAEASAGAAAFSHFAGLAQKRDLRAELHELFAKACLDGAHIRHVRDLDAFINASLLADHELTLELTHALRIVLARDVRDGRFEFETGTDRSIAIFKHLLSLVRRAPDVFATLASPEGGSFGQRAIEHRLLDERLDHNDRKAAPRDVAVSPTSAEIARRIGLHAPYTQEAVQAARRDFAARCHPDRAPAHKRQQATQALAMVNAALDEIVAKLTS